jgi:acylphosphatase
MAIRRHVYYYGDVQGVGFRHAAVRAAAGLAVTGFVRNLRDGRVELVAEGEPEGVARLLDGVGRAMGGRITRREEAEEPPTGQFGRFSVAYGQ